MKVVYKFLTRYFRCYNFYTAFVYLAVLTVIPIKFVKSKVLRTVVSNSQENNKWQKLSVYC